MIFEIYYIFKQLDVLLISILGSSKACCFHVSVHFSDPAQKCPSKPEIFNKSISLDQK